MARLLLLAHAPLATALQAVARHAFPECADRLAALDVMPESHAEEIEALARQCILALSKGTDPETVVLSDWPMAFGFVRCRESTCRCFGVPSTIADFRLTNW